MLLWLSKSPLLSKGKVQCINMRLTCWVFISNLIFFLELPFFTTNWVVTYTLSVSFYQIYPFLEHLSNFPFYLGWNRTWKKDVRCGRSVARMVCSFSLIFYLNVICFLYIFFVHSILRFLIRYMHSLPLHLELLTRGLVIARPFITTYSIAWVLLHSLFLQAPEIVLRYFS